jgi:hypothetical protein
MLLRLRAYCSATDLSRLRALHHRPPVTPATRRSPSGCSRRAPTSTGHVRATGAARSRRRAPRGTTRARASSPRTAPTSTHRPTSERRPPPSPVRDLTRLDLRRPPPSPVRGVLSIPRGPLEQPSRCLVAAGWPAAHPEIRRIETRGRTWLAPSRCLLAAGWLARCCLLSAVCSLLAGPLLTHRYDGSLPRRRRRVCHVG